MSSEKRASNTVYPKTPLERHCAASAKIVGTPSLAAILAQPAPAIATSSLLKKYLGIGFINPNSTTLILSDVFSKSKFTISPRIINCIVLSLCDFAKSKTPFTILSQYCLFLPI